MKAAELGDHRNPIGIEHGLQLVEAAEVYANANTCHRLLGDGPHAAQACRGHDPNGGEPAVAPREHRPAGCRGLPGAGATPTCRATVRWVSSNARCRRSINRCNACVRLRTRRSTTGTTWSARSPPWPMAIRQGVHRNGWQLRGGHTRYGIHRKGLGQMLMASRSTSAPSSTAATSCAGKDALILPCLGRSEIDIQAGGAAVV